LSKWSGEGEKRLVALFEEAVRASPSLLFFDECDAMAPARGTSAAEEAGARRLLSQLLLLMSQLQEEMGEDLREAATTEQRAGAAVSEAHVDTLELDVTLPVEERCYAEEGGEGENTCSATVDTVSTAAPSVCIDAHVESSPAAASTVWKAASGVVRSAATLPERYRREGKQGVPCGSYQYSLDTRAAALQRTLETDDSIPVHFLQTTDTHAVAASIVPPVVVPEYIPRRRKDVMIVGATNRPSDLDPAFLRRFEKRMECGLPTFSDRIALLAYALRNMRVDLSDADRCDIASKLEGWNCADILQMTADAAMQPIREAVEPLLQHILCHSARVLPSTARSIDAAGVRCISRSDFGM
jgi:SpoVK/Ycf46/Vps4 family AAA+-type ATPase